MKTEEEIKKMIKWCESEIKGIENGDIPTTNFLASIKYYQGAITNLKWVLESEGE